MAAQPAWAIAACSRAVSPSARAVSRRREATSGSSREASFLGEHAEERAEQLGEQALVAGLGVVVERQAQDALALVVVGADSEEGAQSEGEPGGQLALLEGERTEHGRGEVDPLGLEPVDRRACRR